MAISNPAVKGNPKDPGHLCSITVNAWIIGGSHAWSARSTKQKKDTVHFQKQWENHNSSRFVYNIAKWNLRLVVAFHCGFPCMTMHLTVYLFDDEPTV